MDVTFELVLNIIFLAKRDDQSDAYFFYCVARYQRLEVERKKIRVHRQVSQQPMIRVHSFAVPCLDDQPEVYGAAVNTKT